MGFFEAHSSDWTEIIMPFISGGSPVLYTPAPRGECENCCVIREARDIKFLLYTRENPKESQQLYVSDTKRLKRSHLNTSLPLILYLHGFSESAPGPPKSSSYEMRDGELATIIASCLINQVPLPLPPKRFWKRATRQSFSSIGIR